MKPPKFLITHNEAAQPKAAFIVHTQDPAFVGKIITFVTDEELQEFLRENNSIDEYIVVNQRVIIHIQQYLTSTNFRRISWLKKRLKNWLVDYLGKE